MVVNGDFNSIFLPVGIDINGKNVLQSNKGNVKNIATFNQTSKEFSEDHQKTILKGKINSRFPFLFLKKQPSF